MQPAKMEWQDENDLLTNNHVIIEENKYVIRNIGEIFSSAVFRAYENNKDFFDKNDIQKWLQKFQNVDFRQLDLIFIELQKLNVVD